MANKNMKDRVLMVEAMEFICRQINNEDIFYVWLMGGVADGDIPYGQFSVNGDIESSEAYFYAQNDDWFADLMGCFLHIMADALKDGGLWCGDVVSKD